MHSSTHSLKRSTNTTVTYSVKKGINDTNYVHGSCLRMKIWKYKCKY